MELNEFFDYKNQLMRELCHNKKIVNLITDKENERMPVHTLTYRQIFPYEFIPETVNDGQTFICFDVDVADVVSKTFYVPVLYVWVFTHKSKLRLPVGGVRTDELASEINIMLNGSRYYGLGELNLVSVGRFSPINDYLGRVLTYNTIDFNRLSSKKPPSNRKNIEG